MSGIRFECVTPSEEEAKVIMKWRNDPETLKMSFHRKPKQWESFYPEFLRDYFSHPNLPPLFIVKAGERIGFIRFRKLFHPSRNCSDISIIIDPKIRGQGAGAAALKLLKGWLLARGVDDVVAEMKVENKASQKLFEKAGYKYEKTLKHPVLDTGEAASVHRYVLSLTPQTEKKSVFIIAEAGSNWAADTPQKGLERAKELIDIAAEAGANAVKFQTFRADTLYVKNAGAPGYLSEEGLGGDIREILKKSEMPYEMIPKLASYCQERGVEFMSSVFSSEDFAAVDPYVARHKLASYVIAHKHLIELMARSKKPVIMSTGCSYIEEISWAVELFRQNGGGELALLQCTAKYPAPLKSLNLLAIPYLAQKFNLSAGLSDHSREPFVGPVAAVALGARVIEKHVTIDRTLQGPDHPFSLEPNELKLMVRMIRQTEEALGSGVKTVLAEEEELYHYAKCWLQATKDIAQGEIFRENENFAILRPGNRKAGAHPKHIQDIEGKKARKDIPLGQGVSLSDID